MLSKNEIMKLGVDRAFETMSQGIGGPFGAVIVKDGEVISVASNSVLADHDPTAHAEVNAIREACKKLGTHDLTGCTIFCTSEPCPMCLSAIIWANMKKAIYGCTATDAAEIGFRDDYIYQFIRDNCSDESVLELSNENRDTCIELFKAYHEENREMY